MRATASPPSGDDDLDAVSASSPPSEEEARVILGMTSGTDDLVAAKAAALAAGAEPSAVEAAYDALVLASFRARVAGSATTDPSVRYADVPKYRPPPPKQPPARLPVVGARVVRAGDGELQFHAATFGLLSLWAFSGGLAVTPGGQDEVPGLQLALALAAGVYFQSQRKGAPSKTPIGRAVGTTAAGLAGGLAVGALLQAGLRVDVLPLAGNASPAALVSVFAILGAWAATSALDCRDD